MDRATVEDMVLRVLAAVLDVAHLSTESSRDNTPEWDSLRQVQIIFAVEDEFGVEFTESELSGLGSVAALTDAVVARHAA
jgi:acyl carrier protein